MKSISAEQFEQSQQEITRLLALIGRHENTIQTLQHQLHLFRTARFGRKTEKGVVSEHIQLQLQFDEAEFNEVINETEENISNNEEQTETITYTRNKKNTGRKELPRSLPYIEKIHDLTDAEKQCGCGCALTHIKDVITEQLDVVPQMTFRVVHIRKQYACKSCENTMKLATLPTQPIPKSIATPGLLAAIIDSKFNRHMPLYRQEAMFEEAKISITRGSLSNWLIKSANLLTPLVKLMESDINDYDVAYADETPLQVLKEKDRSPSQKSYMWLFIGGPPEKRAFVYQYHPTRAHKIAYDFFEDFTGYLHADCYKAYISLEQLKPIRHVACWAHARRYFVDVVKASKKEGLAHQIVKLINRLYELERKLKEQQSSASIIVEKRNSIAKPILTQIKTLLEEAQFKMPAKSPLSTAVFYTLNHWLALNVYLDDGRLEIDNNRSERSIKPFVIGRKNWLFHGNDLGAHAGSILFSLIETCKQHKINVFSWLKYTLSNIHSATTVELLEKLLPYNIDHKLLDDMRSIPNLIMPNKEVVN